MKSNHITFMAAILAASLSFVACGDDDNSKKDDKCSANVCKDAVTLLVCDTATGKTTEKACDCDLTNNACKDTPVGEKCTANKCKDASTLLMCDITTGVTTEKACECDLINNACKDAPSEEKCTADKCKDANTLLVCDKATGKTSEKTCECDMDNNACKDAPSEEKCTADKCKDANTLLVCDTATGQTTEKACECDLEKNECNQDGPVEGNCTADKCKDANTLLICDTATGQTTEKTCECDMDNNVCKDEPAVNSCINDICADAKALMKCDNGTAQKQPCADDELCTFGKCEKKSLSDYDTCTKATDPVCIGDTMYMICDTYDDGETYDPIFHHCVAGTTCKEGACVPTKAGQCVVTACKDLDNIAECNDGVETVKPCGSGKICMQDACVDANGVKSCKADADCGDDTQKCYDNVCYTKSNFDLKVGDPCDSKIFEEYCKDDSEYKCGYDGTVEMNDCSQYNGCGLMFQKAYDPNSSKEYPIRNAACRGDSARLSECEHAGTTNYYCQSYDDTEMNMFSFSYSTQDKCVVGTDGKMIFAIWSIQTSCGENQADKCDQLTGLCIE